MISIEARLHHLATENAELRKEVQLLRGNPRLAQGLRGEVLIAEIVSGSRAKGGSSYDVEANAGRLRIEVKFSSLLTGISGRPLCRWVWTKLFGELGRKSFHRLILVGESDSRFAAHYREPQSPYVIFDLSYRAAGSLVGGVRPGRSCAIQLTTNPASVKSARAIALFQRHQITVEQLQSRYLRHVVGINMQSNHAFENGGSQASLRSLARTVQREL
jgi:hypothetical protein